MVIEDQGIPSFNHVPVFVNEEMKMEEEYKQAKTLGILFLDLNNPSNTSTSTFTDRPWPIPFQG